MRPTHTVAVLLALLLILAGCAPSVRPGTPDVPPSEGTGAPQSPAATGEAAPESPASCLYWARSLPQASLLDPPLQWPLPRYVTEGTCRLYVHSEEVKVDLILPPSADPAAAEAALQVTGAGKPQVEWMTDSSGEHVFIVRFPAGEPGEKLSVRLAGPFGPDGDPVDLGFALERVTTPRVALEYRTEGGEWMPVEPGSTLPHRPMDLRFVPVGGADLDEIAGRLAGEGLAAERQAGALTVHLDNPPPHLAVDLNRVAADHGMLTTRSFLEFFTAAEPQVSLLDPENGQEQVLGSAPVNVYATLAAPSGDRAALMATDPVDPYGTQIWVLDVLAGDLHLTGITPASPWYHTYWRPGELVVADDDRIHRWRDEAAQATVQRSHGRAFTALSPNGRFLAGIAFNMWEADEDSLAPASIVLHDLETGAERILAERRIRLFLPGTETEPRLQLSFSPDGSALLIREPAPESGAWRYVRLDVASDTLEEVMKPPAAAQQEWVSGPHGLAYQVQAWPYADVVVRGADGAERQYGIGHVVGWLPGGRLLLIRWAHGQWLRFPLFI